MKLSRSFAPAVMALTVASALLMCHDTPVVRADPPARSEAETVAARDALRQHLKWARSRPDGPEFRYFIDANIAMTDPDRHFVSFTHVRLEPDEVREGDHENERAHHRRDQILIGDGKQCFSDRTWQLPDSKIEHPFDPNKLDDLGILIDVEAATLTITLKSWGNGEGVIPLTSVNGTLHGYLGTEMFVVDLNDQKKPR